MSSHICFETSHTSLTTINWRSQLEGCAVWTVYFRWLLLSWHIVSNATWVLANVVADKALMPAHAAVLCCCTWRNSWKSTRGRHVSITAVVSPYKPTWLYAICPNKWTNWTLSSVCSVTFDNNVSEIVKNLCSVAWIVVSSSNNLI